MGVGKGKDLKNTYEHLSVVFFNKGGEAGEGRGFIRGGS